jgi:hypothetical protein
MSRLGDVSLEDGLGDELVYAWRRSNIMLAE